MKIYHNTETKTKEKESKCIFLGFKYNIIIETIDIIFIQSDDLKVQLT